MVESASGVVVTAQYCSWTIHDSHYMPSDGQHAYLHAATWFVGLQNAVAGYYYNIICHKHACAPTSSAPTTTPEVLNCLFLLVVISTKPGSSCRTQHSPMGLCISPLLLCIMILFKQLHNICTGWDIVMTRSMFTCLTQRRFPHAWAFGRKACIYWHGRRSHN